MNVKGGNNNADCVPSLQPSVYNKHAPSSTTHGYSVSRLSNETPYLQSPSGHTTSICLNGLRTSITDASLSREWDNRRITQVKFPSKLSYTIVSIDHRGWRALVTPVTRFWHSVCKLSLYILLPAFPPVCVQDWFGAPQFACMQIRMVIRLRPISWFL